MEMHIEHNKNLQEYNTFMVPARARYFAAAQDNESLYRILASKEWEQSINHFILGGGSNVLFVDDYPGFVLKNEIKGIDITHEDDESITVRVGAGENWHDFVMWSVQNNYWGIENLVYIPGSVGAAPVQNIGAYGVEVAETISMVECIELPEAEKKILFRDECLFSYRNSIFKQEAGKYIITYVYFKLQKKSLPNLSYGRVKDLLLEQDIDSPKPLDIANIIMEIRKTKLPELGEIGMAGSFFKNPVISKDHFVDLQSRYPDIKYFELGDGIKIPAGWILEHLGYKGFKKDNVGNYKKHALVVTHNGEGTGEEVWNHVQDIMKKVKDHFDINLEPEVNILKLNE